MGIPSDYDDNVEHKNMHPLLLPKAEAEGVISKQNIEGLKGAIMSTENQEHKKCVKSKLYSTSVKVVVNEGLCWMTTHMILVTDHTGL